MNITFYSNKTQTEYCLIPVCANYTLIRRNTVSSYHLHPVYHLLFVTEGEGFLESENSTFQLKEKDISLINPNEKHIFTSCHPAGMTYITFNFFLVDIHKCHNINMYEPLEQEDHVKFISRIAETISLDQLFDFDFTDIFLNYDTALWERTFTLLHSFLDQLDKCSIHSMNSFRKDYASNRKYWFNLFSKMFWDFYLLLSFNNEGNQLSKKNDNLMERIIRYLEDNVCEKYSLKMLAEHLNYNPIYLCLYFKKNAGLTMNRYFNKLKIIKSCEYLRSTGKSLTEIASLLNFSSSNHFSRAFKAEKNMPPKDYRKHLEKY